PEVKAAEVARKRADDETDGSRGEGGNEPDYERNASTKQRPREDIPAEGVSSEPVDPAWWLVALAQTTIVGRLLRSEDRPDHQDGDHDDSNHRQAVTTEADQCPTEWGRVAGDRPSNGVGTGHAW